MLEQHEIRHSIKPAVLRAAAAVGLADLGAGRYEAVEVEDVETFLARLLEPAVKA